MARKRPPDRLERLVQSATDVFIERGYRRTQMDDVAAALGVSKGTLYLYVESKEALFDLVCRALAAGDAFAFPEQLPVPSPDPEQTVQVVAEQLSKRQQLPALVDALQRQNVPDIRAEVEGIVAELHDTLDANRRVIKLIDRVAVDHPGLKQLWFQGAREGVLGLLAAYLQDRAGRGLVRASPDPLVLARLCLETLSFWAVHRHWDAHPQVVDEAVARGIAIDFAVDGLLGCRVD